MTGNRFDRWGRRNGPIPRIHSEAAEAYGAAGWNITPYGRGDAGTVVGLCARCHEPACRYGVIGQPLCPYCKPRGCAA